MLLNLMAALSLASIGAVAGVSFNARDVIGRKDARFAGDSNGYSYFLNDHAPLTDDVLFDQVLHFYSNTEATLGGLFTPSASSYRVITGGVRPVVCFATDGFVAAHSYIDEYSYYIDGNACVFGDGSHFEILDDIAVELRLNLLDADNSWLSDVDWANARLTILKSGYSWNDYESSHQIVSGIASGLTSVQHYATSLVSGFDALALDNGALTNSMAFAFTLLGIGTAVGICKLTFNWITGRHGM